MGLQRGRRRIVLRPTSQDLAATWAARHNDEAREDCIKLSTSLLNEFLKFVDKLPPEFRTLEVVESDDVPDGYTFRFPRLDDPIALAVVASSVVLRLIGDSETTVTSRDLAALDLLSYVVESLRDAGAVEGDPLPSPTIPLVEKFLAPPLEAQRNDRPDRILPASVALVREDDSRAGRLFRPATHVAQRSGEQKILPGFERDIQGPALPLLLYDLGLESRNRSGKGAAPVALRLFVEAILSVPQSDRDGEPRVLTVTLRDLKDKLWPGRRKSAGEVQKALERASEALDSAWLPIGNQKRRVVLVSAIPMELDAELRLTVDLPAGSEKGPIVTPNLAEYGVESAPAYRALLNLSYEWFHPGRTRIPVGPARNPHWTQSKDPRRYPKLTGEKAVEWCFPTSTTGQRSVLELRAERTIKYLEQKGELRVVDGHVMPPL